MLELKLGKMTTEELAIWADKSSKYLADHKKLWCENNLKIYADYELCRGGVIIKNIKHPFFLSSGLQEVREKYRKYWGYDDLSIDTNTKCWIKMSADMVNQIKADTGKKYVGQCRREDYGVARRNNKYTGKKGSCHYIFCKNIDGQPALFTEDELRIKTELWNKHMKTNEQDEIEKRALTAEYQRGEITDEEYAQTMANLITNDKGWCAFQDALEKAIGCPTDFFIEVVDDAIKYTENNIPFEF